MRMRRDEFVMPCAKLSRADLIVRIIDGGNNVPA